MADLTDDERTSLALADWTPLSSRARPFPHYVDADGGLRQDGDDEDRSTSDGAAVGEADREADMERSGAGGEDNDTVGDMVSSPSAPFMSDDAASQDRGSGDDVPVGAADAEADRQRT